MWSFQSQLELVKWGLYWMMLQGGLQRRMGAPSQWNAVVLMTWISCQNRNAVFTTRTGLGEHFCVERDPVKPVLWWITSWIRMKWRLLWGCPNGKFLTEFWVLNEWFSFWHFPKQYFLKYASFPSLVSQKEPQSKNWGWARWCCRCAGKVDGGEQVFSWHIQEFGILSSFLLFWRAS